MEVLKNVRDLKASVSAARAGGSRVALVPTLGALHAGHMALVRAARVRVDWVVVSIFVNPAQFGPGEDFSAYPRTLEADLAFCREADVAAVFVPSEKDLYLPGAQTWVEVTELSKFLCGASRPGHFRGVATVVLKLLLAVKPDLAVFGEKDYQQLAVVRRLVRDLLMDVEIMSVPIQRELDGLALSSRNRRLSTSARAQAPALARALAAARSAVEAGECTAQLLLDAVQVELSKASLAEVEYVELRDAETLEPSPEILKRDTLLALAVRFPSCEGAPVRLIDNCVLRPGSQ